MRGHADSAERGLLSGQAGAVSVAVAPHYRGEALRVRRAVFKSAWSTLKGRSGLGAPRLPLRAAGQPCPLQRRSSARLLQHDIRDPRLAALLPSEHDIASLVVYHHSVNGLMQGVPQIMAASRASLRFAYRAHSLEKNARRITRLAPLHLLPRPLCASVSVIAGRLCR